MRTTMPVSASTPTPIRVISAVSRAPVTAVARSPAEALPAANMTAGAASRAAKPDLKRETLNMGSTPRVELAAGRCPAGLPDHVAQAP
ncbi:MAG: hypothetical protein [Inoviridae sp.]|nr:MAG: hypothetical protein [Inoviridae sp.]